MSPVSEALSNTSTADKAAKALLPLDDFTWNSWSAMETQWRVERLLSRYVTCIDEDDLENWPEFFALDTCRYEIITRENVERGMPLALMFCTGTIAERNCNILYAVACCTAWPHS